MRYVSLEYQMLVQKIEEIKSNKLPTYFFIANTMGNTAVQSELVKLIWFVKYLIFSGEFKGFERYSFHSKMLLPIAIHRAKQNKIVNLSFLAILVDTLTSFYHDCEFISSILPSQRAESRTCGKPMSISKFRRISLQT